MRISNGIYITKDDSIIHKEIGQGYISINDVLDGYESPWVILLGQGRFVELEE